MLISSASCHASIVFDAYKRRGGEGSEEKWAEISRLAPLENVTLHFGEPIPKLERRKRKKKKAKAKTNENE